MINRRWVATGLALLAALAGALAGVVALPATPAYAHAQLVGTTPANGARLDRAPAEIVLRFSERIMLVRDGIRLLDGAGGAVSAGAGGAVSAGLPGYAARVDETGREAILPVPAGLGTGAYVVSWRVVSADSHPIHGAFAFGIGDTRVEPLPDAGAQATADPGLSTVYWLFRWLAYTGLALLYGGVLFLFVCWPSGWAHRRVRRILLVGWVASVVSAAGVLLIQGPYANGGTLRSLTDTDLLSETFGSDFGRFMATRFQLLALAGVLLALLVRRRPDRPRWTIWAACGLGVALPVTWIGTGHANAQTNPLAWAADVLHLGAMAAWFGGLVLLVAALLSRAAAPPLPEVAVAVTRFSRIATVCVGLLVVTGTYQAWRGVGSLGALAGSGYGRLLVFKLAAVGLLLWLGWMSRAVVHRHFAAQLSTVDGAKAAGVTEDATAVVRGQADLAMAGRTGKPNASGKAGKGGGGPGRPGRAVAAGARGPSRSAKRSDRANLERDQLARGRLRWSVWIEVAVAVAVLAITSLLVATPPGARPAAAEGATAEGAAAEGAAPAAPQQSAAAQPEVVSREITLTPSGRVYVQLQPAKVGDNSMIVAVLDGESKPWDVPEVTATLSLTPQGIGPLPVTLRKVRAGDYTSTALTIPIAGTWQLKVTIRTTEINQFTVETSLPVS